MNQHSSHSPPPIPAPVVHHSHFRRWFWLVIALLFVGFISLIHSILLPFVVGILAAYFLDPAVRKLRAHGLSRSAAAGVITVGFFVIAAGLCVILVPPSLHQLLALIRTLPDALQHLENKYGRELSHYLSFLGYTDTGSLKDSLSDYSGTVMTWVGSFAGGALQSGLAFLNILSLIFITPIVAFYLLRDWHVVVSRFYTLLPRDQATTISEQLHEIDLTLSGFLRGQTNVCLIMAVYYGLLLSLIGLSFGLLIGIATGLLLFIPIVGYVCCFALSVVIALFQFDGTTQLVAVIVVYGLGAVFENSVLIPRLVGSRVGLHPLWVIFGMLAGAALFGFVGILISVPVTAVLGVLVRFGIGRYLKSTLYTGEPHVIPPAPPRQ